MMRKSFTRSPFPYSPQKETLLGKKIQDLKKQDFIIILYCLGSLFCNLILRGCHVAPWRHCDARLRSSLARLVGLVGTAGRIWVAGGREECVPSLTSILNFVLQWGSQRGWSKGE